jgi:hypothetical protein
MGQSPQVQTKVSSSGLARPTRRCHARSSCDRPLRGRASGTCCPFDLFYTSGSSLVHTFGATTAHMARFGCRRERDGIKAVNPSRTRIVALRVPPPNTYVARLNGWLPLPENGFCALRLRLPLGGSSLPRPHPCGGQECGLGRCEPDHPASCLGGNDPPVSGVAVASLGRYHKPCSR